MAERVSFYYRFLRPQTSLSTLLAGLGGALYGCSLGGCAIVESALAIVGVVLAHLSVNAINDVQDYLSGLDKATPATPFSGGSKLLVDGRVSLREAVFLAVVTFVAAISIGLYLSFLYGAMVLFFMIAGALIMILYDPFLLRLGLGEFGALLKGVLVFLGCMYIASGQLFAQAVVVGLAYGILSAIALLVNHIPDAEFDARFGRRTIPVILGQRVWVAYMLFVASLVFSITASIVLNLLSIHGGVLALLPMLYAMRVLAFLRAQSRSIDLHIIGMNAFFCKLTLILLTVAIALDSMPAPVSDLTR